MRLRNGRRHLVTAAVCLFALQVAAGDVAPDPATPGAHSAGTVAAQSPSTMPEPSPSRAVAVDRDAQAPLQQESAAAVNQPRTTEKAGERPSCTDRSRARLKRVLVRVLAEVARAAAQSPH